MSKSGSRSKKNTPEFFNSRLKKRSSSRFASFYVCLALIAITWLVFGQTLGHDFVDFDDHVYVYENPSITRGLSVDGVIGAFTHAHARNWHPLTTISHMLDCQLFGLKARGHHFTNVLLHTIAVLLLFFVLKQMTGAFWPSAFVAAVFAIHPLHVESVALCLALGLMSKPMLVTAPFVLLLLDYWPLNRIRGQKSAITGQKTQVRGQ